MSKVKPGTRQRVLERDGRRCQLCGSRKTLTIDHIVPRSKGGTNRLGNLRILCASCNETRGDGGIYGYSLAELLDPGQLLALQEVVA